MTLLARIKDSSRRRWPWVSLALASAYLPYAHTVLGGIRGEHILANLLLVLPSWLGGERGRQFTWLMLPMWLVGLSYEATKPLVELFAGPPHIQDLYEAEKALFGFDTAEHGRLILAEYFAIYNWKILDIVCGLGYMLYLAPIFIPMILYFRDQDRMQRITWAVLFMNVMGTACYVLYPAAPPWYVAEYGFEYVEDVKPYAAGALRFDEALGINYFENFYKRNATVFGAMPSQHVGWPLTALFGVLGLGWRWVAPLVALTLSVFVGTFYLQHHYLLDTLAGLLLATLASMMSLWMLNRKDPPRTWRAFLDVLYLRKRPPQ